MPDGGNGGVAGELTPSADPAGPEELTSVVLWAARHSAVGGWGQKPQLYALARKAELERSGESLPESGASAAEDALFLIPHRMPRGNHPAEALASIQWSSDVAGCVLVTEVAVSNDEDSGTVSTGSEEETRQGRLTIGVLRDGEYVCCLQFHDELIIGPDLADDLVTALLGTL